MLPKNLTKAVHSVLAEPADPQLLDAFHSWTLSKMGSSVVATASVADFRRVWSEWASGFIDLDRPLSRLGGLEIERTLGNGKLIDTREVAERFLFRPGSIFIGRTIENDIVQLGTDPERISAALGHAGEGHGLVVADTRFGKLVRVLQPTIATWPGSLVTIDNSGELASINAARRGRGDPQYCEGIGQDVFVLDPQNATTVDSEYRAQWNPLDCLKKDDPECIDKAEKLADALIPQEQESSDPYWQDEGRSFLAAVFLYVATEPRYLESGQNTLNTVFQLLSEGDTEQLEALQDMDALPKGEGDPVSVFFSCMAHAEGLRYVSLKGRHLDQLLEGARKQWEGIRSQAQTSLSWVEKPTMKPCIAKSSFSFSDLKRNPNGMSVFISLKDLSTEWRWVRMVLSMMCLESKTYDEPQTGHSTLTVIDEFPKLQAMPVILDFLDCMAKHRVRMLIVCQSLGQLESVYPKDWERFFAAADVRWFFGAESHKVRKFLQEELGETEVVRLTRSQAEALGYSTNASYAASDNESTSTSTNTGKSSQSSWNKGTAKQTGSNSGKSETRGYSYRESILGLVPLLNRIPLLKRANKNFSTAHSSGNSRNDTTSEGTSGGETHSTGEQIGTGAGTSNTYTNGDGHQFTGTQTISETLHKVPVIAASELPYVIGDVDDPNDPRFPGQALISVRGGIRFIVRTTRYFDDPLFYRTFGKHPAHPFRQTPIPWHVWKVLENKLDWCWEHIKARAARERKILREAELREIQRRRFEEGQRRLDAERLAKDRMRQTIDYLIGIARARFTPMRDLDRSRDVVLRFTVKELASLVLPRPVDFTAEEGTPLAVIGQKGNKSSVFVAPKRCRVVSHKRTESSFEMVIRLKHKQHFSFPAWFRALEIDRESSEIFLTFQDLENSNEHPNSADTFFDEKLDSAINDFERLVITEEQTLADIATKPARKVEKAFNEYQTAFLHHKNYDPLSDALRNYFGCSIAPGMAVVGHGDDFSGMLIGVVVGILGFVFALAIFLVTLGLPVWLLWWAGTKPEPVHPFV